MNRKQMKALWIGVAVFVLMGVLPPWVTVGLYGVGHNVKLTTLAGYAPLFLGPYESRDVTPPETLLDSVRRERALAASTPTVLDKVWEERGWKKEPPTEIPKQIVRERVDDAVIAWNVLFLQWSLLALVTGAAIYTLREK